MTNDERQTMNRRLTAGRKTEIHKPPASGRRPEAGFTLVEIVTVVAILVVVFGFAIGIGYRFYADYALISERDNIVNLLRNARSLAMDNYDQASHGVYFGATQYVLFEGDSYAARNQDYDLAFGKSSLVSLAGPAEVVFSAISGAANASGTITLSDSQGSLSAGINYEGKIDW